MTKNQLRELVREVLQERLSKRVLQEVGEANVEPYSWQKEISSRDSLVNYTFTTDSQTDYFIKFTTIDKGVEWDISFFVGKVRSSSIVVNEGELYKVMSTITDITLSFIDEHPEIQRLTYDPTPSKGDPDIDNQRDKLYRRYIFNKLPHAKISDESGTVTVTIKENYADGKVKGKSRPGRVKKAGASCKGSVSDLRAKAKKYGGEKGKMYHWCANMKSGKKKK